MGNIYAIGWIALDFPMGDVLGGGKKVGYF
jgi:hypothetical protein